MKPSDATAAAVSQMHNNDQKNCSRSSMLIVSCVLANAFGILYNSNGTKKMRWSHLNKDRNMCLLWSDEGAVKQ